MIQLLSGFGDQSSSPKISELLHQRRNTYIMSTGVDLSANGIKATNGTNDSKAKSNQRSVFVVGDADQVLSTDVDILCMIASQ